MLNFSEKFAEVLVRNIEKGRKQGYYRTDFDVSIYSKLFFQLMMSYESSPFFDTSEIDREEFHQEAMMLYMNAITTEKGREILKKIYKSK